MANEIVIAHMQAKAFRGNVVMEGTWLGSGATLGLTSTQADSAAVPNACNYVRITNHDTAPAQVAVWDTVGTLGAAGVIGMGLAPNQHLDVRVQGGKSIISVKEHSLS